LDYRDFEQRAHEMFASIPAEYREGVDALAVERAAVRHPSLPEVFTLGECRSEFYPSEFGGAGEVLSVVVLYYGSFLELARREEDWDWEGELWETITHEIRHHLESLATDDSLEAQDYAEDQNFARREGEPFEPFFYRSGTPAGEGVWVVDGDVFVEVRVRTIEEAHGVGGRISWSGREWPVPAPDRLGDVHFMKIADLEPGAGDHGTAGGPDGELIAVLVRRRGLLGWLRAALGRTGMEVLHTDASGRGA
jgi:hypothetical protein